MPSVSTTLVVLAKLGLVYGQAVLLSAQAQGDNVASKGLQVDPNDANDANFIAQSEIVANIVNECGRTLKGGNIDIGEKTEFALSAGEVTRVENGTVVDVTFSQRTPEGAGPFTCDLDPTSNANGITGQTPLDVTQGNAGNGSGDITIQVTMPDSMTCIGASTGNICTVRCRNAQNFGGCFAVQQTDIAANENTPENVASAQTLEGVQAQVLQNIKDLPTSVKVNQESSADNQGVDLAKALLEANPTLVNSAPAELATPTAVAGSPRRGRQGRQGRGRNQNRR